MKYIAANAKISAARAARQACIEHRGHLAGADVTSRSRSGFSGGFSDCEKICCFLPDKRARDFLRRFAEGFRFYENLRHLGGLDKSSRDSLRRVFLIEINLRNVLKIYRLKRFYNLHGDAILPYLAPVGGNAAEISRLAATADLDEFLRGAEIGTGAAFENDFENGEKMIAKTVRAAFKREYRHENLAVACGFLYERNWGQV
ncbi:MAG: V-type ATPase subunit [Defluviitaleaceae bacterium]|nr:V-type ATPase subunit [Defluviitaleaceae bacterium]